MECCQARTKISAYMDQELDEASSRQLESHLHQCAECRETLNDFREIDDLVRDLPKLELGADFAKQMVMSVSEPVAIGEVERSGRLSLFERLFRFIENLVNLVESARSPSTGTLEEFNDFPPLSMGSIYLKLMDLPSQG